MGKSILESRRFTGLDAHADTIAVAVAEKEGEVRSRTTIPNRLSSVRQLRHLGRYSSPDHDGDICPPLGQPSDLWWGLFFRPRCLAGRPILPCRRRRPLLPYAPRITP